MLQSWGNSTFLSSFAVNFLTRKFDSLVPLLCIKIIYEIDDKLRTNFGQKLGIWPLN